MTRAGKLFIVLGTQRCGSTYFINSFARLPFFNVRQEILSPRDSYSRSTSFFDSFYTFRNLIERDDQNTRETLLKEFFHGFFRNDERPLMFKLMIDQALDFRLFEGAVLDEFQPLIIKMYRKNLLAMLVSRVRSTTYGNKGTHRTSPLKESLQIRLNPETLLKDLADIEIANSYIDNCFPNYRSTTVVYEELCKNFNGVVGSVLEFMGYDFECIEPANLLKIGSRDVLSSVENANEVKAILDDTDFRRFYYDDSAR